MNDTPQRPPFQFSLKTIFVLMLVVAAFFGGVAVQRLETERIRREMEQTRDVAERSQQEAMMQEARARQSLEELQRTLQAELASQAERANQTSKRAAD